MRIPVTAKLDLSGLMNSLEPLYLSVCLLDDEIEVMTEEGYELGESDAIVVQAMVDTFTSDV